MSFRDRSVCMCCLVHCAAVLWHFARKFHFNWLIWLIWLIRSSETSGSNTFSRWCWGWPSPGVFGCPRPSRIPLRAAEGYTWMGETCHRVTQTHTYKHSHSAGFLNKCNCWSSLDSVWCLLVQRMMNGHSWHCVCESSLVLDEQIQEMLCSCVMWCIDRMHELCPKLPLPSLSFFLK